jgi:hypothetical protein
MTGGTKGGMKMGRFGADIVGGLVENKQMREDRWRYEWLQKKKAETAENEEEESEDETITIDEETSMENRILFRRTVRQAYSTDLDAFAAIDRHQSGLVSRGDLKRFARDAGMKFSKEDRRDLRHQMGKPCTLELFEIFMNTVEDGEEPVPNRPVMYGMGGERTDQPTHDTQETPGFQSIEPAKQQQQKEPSHNHHHHSSSSEKSKHKSKDSSHHHHHHSSSEKKEPSHNHHHQSPSQEQKPPVSQSVPVKQSVDPPAVKEITEAEVAGIVQDVFTLYAMYRKSKNRSSGPRQVYKCMLFDVYKKVDHSKMEHIDEFMDNGGNQADDWQRMLVRVYAKYNWDFPKVLAVFDEFHAPSEQFVESFLKAGVEPPPPVAKPVTTAHAANKDAATKGKIAGGSSRRKSVAKQRCHFRASMYVPVAKEGYLYKKSAGPAPRWQPRFFTLNGHYLNYFADEQHAHDEKEDIKGSFDLDMCTQIRREEGTGAKLTLKLATERLELKTNSFREATAWIQAVSQVCPSAKVIGDALVAGPTSTDPADAYTTNPHYSHSS